MAAILKIVFGRIFCFPTAFWASTSGGFRIVSDTVVFFQFLLRISILRRNIDIGILSVTLRYWMKTA